MAYQGDHCARIVQFEGRKRTSHRPRAVREHGVRTAIIQDRWHSEVRRRIRQPLVSREPITRHAVGDRLPKDSEFTIARTHPQITGHITVKPLPYDKAESLCIVQHITGVSAYPPTSFSFYNRPVLKPLCKVNN